MKKKRKKVLRDFEERLRARWKQTSDLIKYEHDQEANAAAEYKAKDVLNKLAQRLS